MRKIIDNFKMFLKTFKVAMHLLRSYKKQNLLNRYYLPPYSKTYAKIEDTLSVEQIGKAFLFYLKHKEYVLILIGSCGPTFEPTQFEDKNDPSIWKDGYWKWFLSYYY